MTHIWKSRLVAVSPEKLAIDIPISVNSKKGYTYQDLVSIAYSISGVYRLTSQGWDASDFAIAYHSSKPSENLLGKTFNRLFSERSIYSIEAHVEGKRIVVDKGNHRVHAAKLVGIPVMPVWISAPSDEKLDQVQQECEQIIVRHGHRELLNSHHTIVSRLQPIHRHTPSSVDKQRDLGSKDLEFGRIHKRE